MGDYYFVRIINFIPQEILRALPTDRADGLNHPDQNLSGLAGTIKGIVKRIECFASDDHQGIDRLVAVKRVTEIFNEGKNYLRVVLFGSGLNCGMPDFWFGVIQ